MLSFTFELFSRNIVPILLKCTTCHHYTNIIKIGLINLIKIGNIFITEKGPAYFEVSLVIVGVLIQN